MESSNNRFSNFFQIVFNIRYKAASRKDRLYVTIMSRTHFKWYIEWLVGALLSPSSKNKKKSTPQKIVYSSGNRTS